MNLKIKKHYIVIAIIIICSALVVISSNLKMKSEQKQIGILQFIEHDCLDMARKGFVDELASQGYEDGKNITIDYQNAQGDQSVCNSIANNFVGANNKKDLILAIATPAAQSVANLTKDIPTLITAVTDPVSCGLVKSVEHPGGNITGTSDRVAVGKQIDLIKKLNPNAKKIGVLYCSSEANSKVQAQTAADEAKKLGLEARDYTVSSSSELQQMVEYMCGEVDVIFVPTDNLVVSCMPLVSKVATANKTPIICSESASVKNGALATYGIDFYELGRITARQAIRILKGEAKPENMAIEYMNEPKFVINYEIAKQLGIVIPDELKGELQ